MSYLQLLKLAERGCSLLASRRKILVVATGCLFASGTTAYMYYRKQNRTSNPDHSDNEMDGENGKEKSKRNGLENKSTEKRGHKKGLKSLRILAAILLSKIGHIAMQKLYALVTRTGRGMLRSMHFDISKIECSSQEDLENHKAGQYHKAREKQLHGSLMPESANESHVSNAEDSKIVEVPSKNSHKKKSLSAQVDTETKKGKLIEHKAKLVDSLMPVSENESIGSSAEDLKIDEVASKNSRKKESIGAQPDVETTDRKLIGPPKAKEHGLQGSLMPASESKPDGSKTDDLKIVEVHNKNPQKEKTLGAEVDVEIMKRKLIECGVAADALRVCTLCNIVCNSKSVFDNHIAGQKHVKMLKKEEAPGAVQSLKRDVFKIECTSQDVLERHDMGNKHKTKEKQPNDSLIRASESKPIGTDTKDLKIPQVTRKRSRKKKSVLTQADPQTTKHKLIEKGVAADSFRVCTLCNIVCTSKSVFNGHIAGQRHARMLKKQGVS